MPATILVVDDTPDNLDAFCNILDSYMRDLVLIRASSGPECIEMARKRIPDAILLDVHMPGMDGFEVCRLLKSDPATQNISVLMVSALMTAGRHRATGMDCGADGYLCKPFDSAELISQMRALIRLKRYEDTLREHQAHLEEELRKRTDALKESELNWRRMFQEAPDPMLITGMKGEIQEANRAGCDLHGYTRGELMGRNIRDLVPAMHRDRLDACLDRWKENALRAFDGCVLSADGHEIAVDVRVRHFEYHGEAAVLFQMRDIRERLRMELELRQAQKLESVSLLAGGIAHDFTNILTGVLGNLSLLKMEMEESHPLRKRIGEAEEQALRAKLLTRQLLTFSKGGAPILKPASIRHLLEEVPRFVLSGSKTICQCDIQEDLASVDMDVCQMSQVIENLIVNAAQAMPAGGIIRLVARNAVADPEWEKTRPARGDGRRVRIDVIDQGIGIPDENLSRIFDPYFTTKEKGTGLGLSTCYAIVRQHGGEIGVESREGKGSTFHMILPASERQVEEDVPPEADESIPGHGRILVMDDEAPIRLLLESALSKLGYDVMLTADGREALNAYQAAMHAGNPFDAVIFDLTIPGGMGGEEAAQLIRALDPSLKAVVSSGYSNGQVIGFPQRSGFQAAIEKPYRIPVLSKVLHDLLANP